VDRQDERRERFVIYYGAASGARRHWSQSAELPTPRLPTSGNIEIEQRRDTRRRVNNACPPGGGGCGNHSCGGRIGGALASGATPVEGGDTDPRRGVARDPVVPAGEVFVVVHPVEVAVDPQHDLPEDVVRAVRIGDAAPDERLQLRAELSPDLFGPGVVRGTVRGEAGVAGGRGHLGSLRSSVRAYTD
jgi:hypothetical protein